ncbi:hypothetical protein GEMRC1_006953 [Eukaryota sp. GEM-RC1]
MVSSNKEVAFIDGIKGDFLFKSPLKHSLSVYSFAWESFDPATQSGVFWTCSSDKSVHRYEVNLTEQTLSCTDTIPLIVDGIKPTIDEQVLGLSFDDGVLYAANLGGDFFKINTEERSFERWISGHRTSVQSVHYDEESHVLITGGIDGSLCFWEIVEGELKIKSRGTRVSQTSITAINYDYGQKRVTIAGHDALIRKFDFDPSTSSFLTDLEGQSCSTVSTEFGIEDSVFTGDYAVYVTDRGIVVLKEDKVVHNVDLYGCRRVALSNDGKTVVVGTVSGDLLVFDFCEGALNQVQSESLSGDVTCLQFSINNDLAVGLGNRKIFVFHKVDDKWTIRNSQFVFHLGRVNCLDFSPCGKFIISGGLDSCVFKWSLESPMKRVKVEQVHKLGVTCVKHVGNDMIVSGGQDGFLRLFKL